MHKNVAEMKGPDNTQNMFKLPPHGEENLCHQTKTGEGAQENPDHVRTVWAKISPTILGRPCPSNGVA